MAVILSVGALAAEAPVRRTRLVLAPEPGRLMGNGRACAGEGEAVKGRIRVGYEPQGIAKRCRASMVDSFAEQQDGATKARRLGAKLFGGKGDGIQNSGSGI